MGVVKKVAARGRKIGLIGRGREGLSLPTGRPQPCKPKPANRADRVAFFCPYPHIWACGLVIHVSPAPTTTTK